MQLAAFGLYTDQAGVCRREEPGADNDVRSLRMLRLTAELEETLNFVVEHHAVAMSGWPHGHCCVYVVVVPFTDACYRGWVSDIHCRCIALLQHTRLGLCDCEV